MNIPELIDIDLIHPNPYQPRENEDQEHIQKLASSIATEGLLQIPHGRRTTGGVQLAFGHSRLAAYRLLHNQGTPGFDQMPVIIRELNNDEMFRLAVRENLDRKDLSALETARAMQRYRQEFNKTSAEIGELFGLSDSAVRGKLRLLSLPADLQGQLAGVRELVLRELLVLFDLPEEVQKRAEQTWPEQNRPSQIIRSAINGASSETIHNSISNIFRENGSSLSQASWKWDQTFNVAGTHYGMCKGCSYKFERDKQPFCFQRGCYSAKEAAGRIRYLEEATRASGISAHEDLSINRYAAGAFDNADQAATALQAKCSNLRLIYIEHRYSCDFTVEGFEHAMLVCKKGNFCTCRQAVKAGDKRTKEKIATEEELQEVVREARAKRRQNLSDIQAMKETASKAMADALAIGNPALLYRILRACDWQLADKYRKQDKRMNWGEPWGDQWHTHTVELRRLLAQFLAERAWAATDNSPEPNRVLAELNGVLDEAHLPLMEFAVPEPVSVETPKNGKTLVEIFAQE